jgi:hypothetical protein
MVAERRATRMLILIPVFAVLLALVFSLTGLNPGKTVAEKPAPHRALIQAAVFFSDALYVTATGAQALLAERK